MSARGGTALLAGVVAAGVGAAWLRRRGAGTATRDVAIRGAGPVELSGAAPLADRRRAHDGLGTGHVAPPAWEPAALGAVATWVPAPPASRLGRLLALVWAAPLSVLGVALAAASGAVPRRRSDVWVAAPARGLFGVAFQRRGFAACTLGHVVVAAHEPSDALLRHERVHTRHSERLGPLTAPAYLGLMAVYGYTRHPLERAARAGARAGGTPRRPVSRAGP